MHTKFNLTLYKNEISVLVITKTCAKMKWNPVKQPTELFRTEIRVSIPGSQIISDKISIPVIKLIYRVLKNQENPG